MSEKVFRLEKVGLVQAGKSILSAFGPFALGLILSIAYTLFFEDNIPAISFHFRNAFVLSAIVYVVMYLYGKKKTKTKDFANQFVIRIVNDELTIEIDHTVVFNGNIHELKAIRTLDLSNKKNSVQCQIYIGKEVFSLASSLNSSNKSAFDYFVKFCEKQLHMEIKSVPFSIYTHNWQGIKYLEYFNPENPLSE